MVKKEIKSVKVKEIKAPSGKLKRVPTGVPGFDELIEGGFPMNSSTLVVGGPGTGKSIFSMNFLVNGAEKFGEKCMYVSFEQRAEALREQGMQFGWDLAALEKKGTLKILSIPVQKITKETIKDIQEAVKKGGVRRLVIDSLSTLVVNAPIYVSSSNLAVEDVVGENVFFSPPIVGDYIVKRFIYDFIDSLKELDCTTILIGESAQSGEFITRDTISEFASDGIIMINFESLGGAYSRSLIVRKMRETKNDEDVHPMEISKSGVIVHKIE